MTTSAAIAPTAAGTTEFIFLGTGTSSSLPHLDCLTRPPDVPQCRTCLSTLTPEGVHNIRRNTSAVLRLDGRDGKKVTVVIDAGKTFQAAALQWFPKYGLRRIDAVLITHAHADAMNGLDDLRGWTLRGAIQPHVDLYVSQTTFKEVQRSFPYLVSKVFASGGGDVPEFKWHIIEDRVPFEIGDTGVRILPFAVHHGHIFNSEPIPSHTPMDNLPHHSKPLDLTDLVLADTVPKKVTAIPASRPQSALATPKAELTPMLCYGFLIQDQVLYMSDVSHIPDDVWPLLTTRRSGSSVSRSVSGANGNGMHTASARLPIFICDCLHLFPHSSHLGLREAVATARRVNARRTYLTGFAHDVAQDEYERICRAVGTGEKRASAVAAGAEPDTENTRIGIEMVLGGEPIWMRPAHDGLRICIGRSGEIEDGCHV